MNNQSNINNQQSTIRIGCQGWNYDDWTTRAGGDFVFYPRGTRSGEMLKLYAEIFDTIEVDSTFYAIPPQATFTGWYEKTPENFTFSLKLPQEITHTNYLRKESFPMLAEFCEKVRELKEKLAVILVQMPPQFAGNKQNALALRDFLAQLPQDIKFAIEFRHRDWLIEWTFEELEKNNIALCLTEGSWIPRDFIFQAIENLKTDFAYVRFMGERDLQHFDKIYRREDTILELWKEAVEKIKAKEIYIYFSNFFEGHAPASVNKLKKAFGQNTLDAATLENQASLF